MFSQYNEFIAVFQQLNLPAYLVDENMNILCLNDSTRKIFNLEPVSLENKKCYDFLFDKDSICVNCPVLESKKTGIPSTSLIEQSLSIDNNACYILRSSLFDDDNYMVLVIDTTKHFETATMRDDFVATLTHDLRTPLLAAEKTLKLLTNGTFGILNDKQQEVLETMVVSNSSLLLMVKNLLDVYRYEGGAKSLNITSFDIAQLIDDCIFELSPLADVKNIQLNVTIPEIMPLISADKRELWRVLVNLISNAIKYTDDFGFVNVSVSFDQSSVIVEVKDNGSGVPEAEVKNLFKRFSQGTSDSISSGTGLGLYLSRQIIQAHKGKIWAVSQEGSGSSFYFSLPV
ncbi:MAG: ATP-binding protein [Vampirovibrionia bacterium]